MQSRFIFLLWFLFFTSTSGFSQKPMDEEKIKKAVVFMQKMMTNPGEMQTVLTELQALKLTSAENKEAKDLLSSLAKG